MAPKVHVPMNFGVHLRSSPTHNTLKLNTSEGGEVLASSVILSFNSPVIDHMTTTLHMTSVDMLEFSEAAVQVFVDAAYSGTAEGINREIFRDINKMSNVFEVVWLVKKCSEYFTEATNSIVTPTYSELLYLFEEACFVLESLNKKDYIKLVNYKIQELDWKQQFIDKYLENADRLSTKKLDMVIELGGSDVNFVVQTLVNQLTEMFKVQGPCLPVSCEYLLENMDLSLCMKADDGIFYQLFDLLQELPLLGQTKWSQSILLRSSKKFTYGDISPSVAHVQAAKCNTIPNLYHNVDFNMNFDELLRWISVSENVTSLFMALEAVCTWTCYHCVYGKHRDCIDANKLTQLKLSLTEMIPRKSWMLLPREFSKTPFRLYNIRYEFQSLHLEPYCVTQTVQVTPLVLKPVETCHDPFSLLSKNSTLTFHFKHPSVTSCILPGHCGFILKTVPSEAVLWRLELCTEEKEYRDSDVHFHKEIRAEKMHAYFHRTVGGSILTFPLTWLSSIIHSSVKVKLWEKAFKFDRESQLQILYNH